MTRPLPSPRTIEAGDAVEVPEVVDAASLASFVRRWIAPTMAIVLTTAIVATVSCVSVSAQAEDERPVPPGFSRVAGAESQEDVDPVPLVVGAYASFFVLMCGYLVHVARSQSAMSKEMADLADRIRRVEKK